MLLYLDITEIINIDALFRQTLITPVNTNTGLQQTANWCGLGVLNFDFCDEYTKFGEYIKKGSLIDWCLNKSLRILKANCQ